MIVLIPSVPMAQGNPWSDSTPADSLSKLIQDALGLAGVHRVVLGLNEGEAAPNLHDPRLLTLAHHKFSVHTTEPFPPGTDDALHRLRKLGLLEQETVFVLDRRKPQAASEMERALAAFEASKADVLASVVPCRDHPCQLQTAMDILGRCVVFMREDQNNVPPQLAGCVRVSKPFPFDWGKSLVSADAGSILFEQIPGTSLTAYRGLPIGADASHHGRTIWMKTADAHARVAICGKEFTDQPPGWEFPEDEDLLAWSIPALDENMSALVRAKSGAWTLDIRLPNPAGHDASILILSLPEEEGAPGQLLETKIPTGLLRFQVSLQPDRFKLLLVSACQPAHGPESDVMFPFAPSLKLWGHSPTGNCVKSDDGNRITGRQDFPEVLELNGAFLILGPNVHSVKTALATQMAHHTLHPEQDGWHALTPAFSELSGSNIPSALAEGTLDDDIPAEASPPQASENRPCAAQTSLTCLKGRSIELARLGERDRIVDFILKQHPQCAHYASQAFRLYNAPPSLRAQAMKGSIIQALNTLPPSTSPREIMELAQLVLCANPTDEDIHAFIESYSRQDAGSSGLEEFNARYTLNPRPGIKHESIRAPFSLAWHPDTRTLAVANEQKGSVSLFGPDCQFLGEIKHPGRLSVGLSFDKEGCLWVATATPDHNNIFYSDPGMTDWTSISCAELVPDCPIPWFVCEHDGRVYVQASEDITYEQSRVVSFRKDNPAGTLLTSEKRMGMPGGIIPLKNRKMLVAERTPPALWLMEPDCSNLTPMANFGPWEQILSLGSDGKDVYLATIIGLIKADANGRVVYFAESESLGLGRPTGLVLADDATLLITDYAGHCVNRYSVAP